MFSLAKSDRSLVREPFVACWNLDHKIAYEDVSFLIDHYRVHEEKWVKRQKHVATVLEIAFAVASLAAMVIPLFYGQLWWIGFPIFFGGGLVLMFPSSLIKSHAKKQERIHAAMCQEKQMLSSCSHAGKYPLSVFNLSQKKLLDRDYLMSDRMKVDEMNSQKRGNRLSQKKDSHGRIYPKSSSPLRRRGLSALDLAETVASKHQRAGVGHLLDPLEEEVWKRKKKAIREARSYDGTEELEKEVSRWTWLKPHWQKAKEANSIKGVAEQTLKQPSLLFQAVDGVNSEQKRLYEEARVRQIPLVNRWGDEVDALDQAYKVLKERVDAFWSETRAKKAEAVGAPYFENRYQSLKQAIYALPRREEIIDRNNLLVMKKRVVTLEREARRWREELPIYLLNELEIEITGLKKLHQVLLADKEERTLSFDFKVEYKAVKAEFNRLKICCSNERVYDDRRYYEMILSEISLFRKEKLKPLAIKVVGERNEHMVLSILRGVGQACKKMAKALVFRFDTNCHPDLVLKTSTFGVQMIGSKNRSINTLLVDADKKLTRWLYVNQLWVKVVALIINVVLIVLVFVIGANSPWIGGALLVPSVLIPMGLYLIKRRIHKLEGRKLEAKLAKHLLDRMPLHLDEIPWEKQQLRHLVGRLSYLDLEPNTLTLARLNEDPNSFAFDKRYQGKGMVARAHRKLASWQTRVPKKWQQQVDPDQFLRRRLVREKKHLKKRLEHLNAMDDVYSVRQHSLTTVGFESKADFEKRGKLPVDEERCQKRLEAIAELDASLREEMTSIDKRLEAIDVMLDNYPIFIKEELELQLEALDQEKKRIRKRFKAIDQKIADDFNVEDLSLDALRVKLLHVKGVISSYQKELKLVVDRDQIAGLKEDIEREKAVEHTLFTVYLYRRFVSTYQEKHLQLENRINHWEQSITRELTEDEKALFANPVEENPEPL